MSDSNPNTPEILSGTDCQDQDSSISSDGHFRALFFLIPDGVVVIDPETALPVHFNPAAHQQLGYTAEEFATLCISDYEAEESPEQTRAHIEKIIRHGRDDFESRHRRKDGSLMDLNVSVLQMNTGGKPYLLCIYRDISAHKQAEQKLQRSETLLASIVDNIPVMVFLKQAGDLRFEMLNRAGEDLLGVSQQDIAGKNDYDFFPWEQADFFTASDRDVLESHQWKDIAEEPIRTSNGEIRILHTRKIGIYDTAGKPTHLLGVSIDVTVRNAMEQALYTSTERLNEAQHIAQVGSWELDLTSGELNWSDEIFRLFEIDKSQFGATYEAFLSAIHPDDRDSVNQAYSYSLENRSPYEITHRLLMSDGRIKWVHERCNSDFDVAGKPLRSVGTVQDITRQWQAEENLRQLNETLEARVTKRTTDLLRAKEEAERANSAKSEFLSRMSHELRTPMNAILGFGQLLESDQQNPLAPDQQESIHEILRAGSHLLELINEVLDLARIESGRLELVPEVVSIGPLVDECAALIQSLAVKHNIQLTSDIKGDYAIQADRLRLRQILLNLLSNAIKYNRDGGSVEIACHPTPQRRIRISVRDSGRGIPADAMEILFKPFERIGSAYDGIEGTGIGLALCKKLTEAMDGTIGVESIVGEGSTFWVELHLAATEAALPAINSAAREHNVCPTLRTLLYIEDKPSNLRLVKKIIASRKGLVLLDTHTAELGLEIARTRQPDLILLDINLPGMDGHEALRHLQNNPATSHIPVIAITANAMERDIRKGLDTGFVAYLTKPLQIPGFLAVLDEILEPDR